MIIPAAIQIEAARDQLLNVDPAALLDQRKELHEAVGATGTQFKSGYELGLQTARVILKTMPKAIAAGVEL